MNRLIRILILKALTSITLLLAPEATVAQAAEPEAAQTAGASEPVMLGTAVMPPDVLNKLSNDQIVAILQQQNGRPLSTAQILFNEAILVPGIVFGSFTIISIVMLYFSFRKRREMLDTVKTAIQSGQTLPASFLEALESRNKPSPDSDLRKAVLLIALGLSGMGVLASLANENTGRAWAIGLVPTLLGIGYLFLWKQSQKRRQIGSSDDAR